MESHPLNLAHHQHRRAKAHLKNNKYDEAMQCHHNAAELLLDAMKSTNSSIALESISLQHSYHLKQKDLIKTKKEQYARVEKAMDHLKALSRDPLAVQNNDPSKVQIAIYKNINDTNALLNTLSNRRDTGHVIILKDVPAKDVVDGKKVEKNQQSTTEEVQLLSQNLHNLHSLVEQLVFQVEILKDENVNLKERINYLEKERVKYLNLPSASTSDLILKHNFSTLDMTPDEHSKDSVPVAIVPPPKMANITPIERMNKQPHFDLSSFKIE